MRTMRKVLFATMGAPTLIIVVACGSGGSTPFGTPSSSSSSSGSTGTGTTTSSTNYSMGNGSGSSFQAGAIDISNASLSAGGTTTLQVSVVNTDNADALYTGGALTVTFSSSCLAAGTATVAASGPNTTAGSTANTFSTNTGEADVTYTAAGCSGSDMVTASSSLNSQNLEASGTITVAAASIGSLQFVSATPTTIGLKGTGIGDTSTVIFKVLDSTGAARPGATVSFALNTTVGGLSLTPASAVSGSNGEVQTVVSSGTVHTAVRVTASIASPALSTQSSQLTVTTGLPASGGFTIAVGPATYPSATASQACPNVEAYNLDGVQVPVTVWLADRYNNPAPDGTAVAFTTDAGNIGGNCTTPLKTSGDGACQVTWTSANPRPQPSQDVPAIPSVGFGMILATAIGEESFVDSTGSGFYVAGDSFSNLGEPYLDENADGIYEYPYEPFLDYYKTGKYEGPSGSFIGIICNGTSATSTCTENTLAIGVLHRIIMSTGGAQIMAGSVSSGGSFTAYAPVSGNYPATAPVELAYSQSGSLTFSLQDLNGNPLAAGSVVSIKSDTSIGQIDSNVNGFTMGCSNAPGGTSYTTTLIAATAPAPPVTLSGNIYVSVVSPGTATNSTFSFPVKVCTAGSGC